jgi:hypothetical protein
MKSQAGSVLYEVWKLSVGDASPVRSMVRLSRL